MFKQKDIPVIDKKRVLLMSIILNLNILINDYKKLKWSLI